MTKTAYYNYRHYLAEGWKDDKQYFQDACELLLPHLSGEEKGTLLDVGCASGNFLAHVLKRARVDCWGVDFVPELVAEGRKKLPEATFIQASALDIPERLWGKFSCITALGVLSCFKYEQLSMFFENLIKCGQPGGACILLFSPLNEYGVDLQIDHRKRMNGNPTDWESAYNIYTAETIMDILHGKCVGVEAIPFFPQFTLAPSQDPQRSWLMTMPDGKKQFMNGFKLLLDYYFIKIML